MLAVVSGALELDLTDNGDVINVAMEKLMDGMCTHSHVYMHRMRALPVRVSILLHSHMILPLHVCVYNYCKSLLHNNNIVMQDF